MSYFLVGNAVEVHGDLYVVDEVGRRFLIEPEDRASYPVGARLVVEIETPPFASLSWEGLVTRRLDAIAIDDPDVIDNHLLAPHHPVIGKAWMEALQRDRSGLYGWLLRWCPIVCRLTLEKTSASGVAVVITYECRSLRACRRVYQAEQQAFPDDTINRAQVSLVAVRRRPMNRHLLYLH